MRKITRRNYFIWAVVGVIILSAFSLGFILIKKPLSGLNSVSLAKDSTSRNNSEMTGKSSANPDKKPDAGQMPVYGHWKTFTTKDGLPSDHVYCVRIDGKRVWAGTHDGLAVYEDGKWKTYTTKDGLPHNGVLAIDVSKQTGDVWIGTLGGLSRYSAGKFENFSQFDSGLPNDLVYCVICDGKDIWTATGGGAGHYDTFTKEWEIFTEKNAPMHEPWTYGVSAGDGKIFIAAWEEE